MEDRPYYAGIIPAFDYGKALWEEWNMVKPIVADNRIKKLVSEHVREYIGEYYPNVDFSNIILKHAFFAWKYHRSIIYQFNISNGNGFRKSLIAKARLQNYHYGDTDKKLDTAFEYKDLSFLNKLDPLLAVPVVFDVLKDEGILLTEKVPGHRLDWYLCRMSYLPFTEKKKRFLHEAFFKAGAWLRAFHDAGFPEKKRSIDTQEFLGNAEAVAREIVNFGFPKELVERVLDKMRSLEADAGRYNFYSSFKHGDFQAMNIIYHAGKVTVLDVSVSKRDITVKDISNFIVGSYTYDIKLPYSTLNCGIFADLSKSYLKGYFKGEKIPYSAIRFVAFLGLLQIFSATYNRNISPIKKQFILNFFKNKISRICEKDWIV